jgi:hypothetical protein
VFPSRCGGLRIKRHRSPRDGAIIFSDLIGNNQDQDPNGAPADYFACRIFHYLVRLGSYDRWDPGRGWSTGGLQIIRSKSD